MSSLGYDMYIKQSTDLSKVKAETRVLWKINLIIHFSIKYVDIILFKIIKSWCKYY